MVEVFRPPSNTTDHTLGEVFSFLAEDLAKRRAQIYRFKSDLAYLLIPDMMAARKINSSESDRCQMIAMENGMRHGEEGIPSS